MHEKHHPISPIKSKTTLKTEFSATKNMDMTLNHSQMMTNRSTIAASTYHIEIPEDDDHPGVKCIKSMVTKPSPVNKALKNPSEFDAFVEHMTARYIPAILMAPGTPCTKIVVFYHANAEDIGQAYSFCKDINDKLEVYP